VTFKPLGVGGDFNSSLGKGRHRGDLSYACLRQVSRPTARRLHSRVYVTHSVTPQGEESQIPHRRPHPPQVLRGSRQRSPSPQQRHHHRLTTPRHIQAPALGALLQQVHPTRPIRPPHLK